MGTAEGVKGRTGEKIQPRVHIIKRRKRKIIVPVEKLRRRLLR